MPDTNSTPLVSPNQSYIPTDHGQAARQAGSVAENLIDTKNYAGEWNEADAQSATAQIVKAWQQAVTFRTQYNQRMMQFYNIWNTIFDLQYYVGNSQVYLPQLRKNVEFCVKNLRQNLFPTDDYFSVESVDELDEEFEERQDDKVQRFLKWQQVNQINLKRFITPWLRQLVMYGWSPARTMWNQETKKIYTHEVQYDPIYQNQAHPLTGQQEQVLTGTQKVIRQIQKSIKTKQAPTFEPVDVFSFYIWPWTCWDIKDAQIVFEELILSKSEILNMVKTDGWDASQVERLLKTPSNPLSSRIVQEKRRRIAQQGFPVVALNEAPEWKILYGWMKLDLYHTGELIDCQVVVGEERIPLVIRQNPFYDQEPPYVLAKLDELVGEFYSKGLIEPLQTLQYLLNDHTNQMNDFMTYSLNPIVKYRPGAIPNLNTIIFAPGAMWATSDLNGIEVITPPAIAGQAFTQREVIEQSIDSYPGFERIPATGRRPATQISALQQERGLPILDWSENIEAMAMNPFLRKQYMLNQQFLEDKVAYKVIGSKLEHMSPEDLVGNYHFFWLGANQTQVQIVKAQQMQNFVPLIMQAGGDAKWVLKKLWSEGYGLDGAENLFGDADLSSMLDPQQENIVLSLGKALPTHPMDDDETHIHIHMTLMHLPLDEYTHAVIEKHIKMHMQKLQQKQMQQQAAVAMHLSNMASGNQQTPGAMQTPPGPGMPEMAQGPGPGQIQPGMVEKQASQV